MSFNSQAYKEPLTPPAVLVVDDDKNIRRGILLMLKSEFDVTAVETGEEAIEKIEQGGDYDVVSLDIRLPGISGIDTLKAIKILSPTTEVLMMTANSDLETARAALKLGAYDYLDKPFKKESFRKTIRKGVERHRKIKASEEELAFVKAQLIQSEKFSSMGQLIAGIVHEINNPLSIVIGFSELLSMPDCSLEQSREYARDISKGAQLCKRIIDKLLAFSRKKSIEKELVQINEILENTLVLKRADLMIDNVDVIKELDIGLPLTVADYHELQQVFLNLINNAHHAMKDQEKDRTITIRSEFDDKLIRSIFEDTGPGIPKENIQRIFEPLFTTKEKGKGTGLGLSVCYEIIQKHKGNIYVASDPGHGASFVIELPIAESVPSVTTKSKPISTDKPRDRTNRILLLDNNADEQDLLKNMISVLGYQPDVASDTSTAQEKIKEGIFDVMICSLDMQDINGHSFHVYLGQNLPEILQRTIFLVNGFLEDEFDEFARTHNTTYLIKPFGIPDFEKAINRSLSNLK